MFSTRFSRRIMLTRHAGQRMIEREISATELVEVIDTGETRYADERRLWAFKHLHGGKTTWCAPFSCSRTCWWSRR